MKYIIPLSLLVTGMAAYTQTVAQNVSINILTHNTGVVKKGSNITLEITINNTDHTDPVASYKLRPQISIPTGIVELAKEGHTLPPGWDIISNEKGVIRLTNGTDKLPPDSARTILLQLYAKEKGGPSSISGNLLFSNGKTPGAASGTATVNDNPADNTSTTTCEVTN